MKKTRVTKQQKKLRREVYLYLLLTLCALFFIVLIIPTQGTASARVQGFFMGLFGYAAYALPFLIGAISVFRLFDRYRKCANRLSAGVSLMFTSLLLFVTASGNGFQTLDFARSYVIGSKLDGGGILGDTLGFLLSFGTGKLALTLVAVCLTAVSVVVTAQESLIEYLAFLRSCALERRLSKSSGDSLGSPTSESVAAGAADDAAQAGKEASASGRGASASIEELPDFSGSDSARVGKADQNLIERLEEYRRHRRNASQTAAPERAPTGSAGVPDPDTAVPDASSARYSQDPGRAGAFDTYDPSSAADAGGHDFADWTRSGETGSNREPSEPQRRYFGGRQVVREREGQRDFDIRRRVADVLHGGGVRDEEEFPGELAHGGEPNDSDDNPDGQFLFEPPPGILTGELPEVGDLDGSDADDMSRTAQLPDFRHTAPLIRSKPAQRSVPKQPKRKPYKLPSVQLLDKATEDVEDNQGHSALIAEKLEETLKSFHVDAQVRSFKRGPAITMYEVVLGPGVKMSKIQGLSDDIALSLAASQVRIAPIAGKSAVGIEVPNRSSSMVRLREIVDSKEFRSSKSKLTMALGKDISGNPIVGDLAAMPHLLIAGATGSGKSVCVNTIISSILFNAAPDEVQFLMIDPKIVELPGYNGIPHLIMPVVTDPKKAAVALNWVVQEMERRYVQFSDYRVRDIKTYNDRIDEMLGLEAPAGEMPPERMPQIVVIIDELADLMMTAPKQVEDSICRIAQKARAAGIHLIVATQRPSVDVITGLIKANIPSRIAFSVSSQVDSRTIIDMHGAEKLLGKGDMLYYPSNAPKPKRVQGAFMSDREVEDVVRFASSQQVETAAQEIVLDEIQSGDSREEEVDELLQDAIRYVMETRLASASSLQRKYRIGYNRAARLIDSMEERGIVGPSRGSKPREVLAGPRDI